MEKSSATQGFSISGVMCSVFGHNFQVTRQVTKHIKEYECAQCKMQATTDVRGNLASLTPQLKDINESLSVLYRKKKSKRKQLSIH